MFTGLPLLILQYFQPRDLERTVLRKGQVNSRGQREMAHIGPILRRRSQHGQSREPAARHL